MRTGRSPGDNDGHFEALAGARGQACKNQRMLFNSLTFIVFFIIVIAVNRRLGHGAQNRFLLVASYVFYGWWDYRFLVLILFSTAVDYYCAGRIHAAADKAAKKRFLALSVLVNISSLGFFKYFNFFAESVIDLFALIGFQPDPFTLNIILPVGISFYTFQSLSYTINVYRGELEPADDFFDFALYVSFFPQLVAGPIERATTLLPQIQRHRSVSLADIYEGLALISVGFVKKLVIADRCGPVVATAFNGPVIAGNGAEAWTFLYLFAFQIYGDFSGYSDIARGCSRILGFDLVRNFGRPYFVSNPSAFWRHWHISLSTWIRDYIYIPLGGNGSGISMTFRNLLLTMFLGGLWHGAGWAYALWGVYHGVLLIFYRVIDLVMPARANEPRNPVIAGVSSVAATIIFFHFTCIGWLLFRTGALSSEYSQLSFLANSFPVLFKVPDLNVVAPLLRLLAVMFVLVAALQALGGTLESTVAKRPRLGIGLLVTCWLLVLTLGVFNGAEFIYFQF